MQKTKARKSLKPVPKIDCFKALKALSDPRRLSIMNLLLAEPLTVGTIAKKFALTTYTASRQLAELERAGLVVCKKDGQHRIYGISSICNVLIDRKARTLSLSCCQFRLDAIIENAARPKAKAR